MESCKGLVSILIPVYNRESMILDTISSALAQTYETIEIVVVDNASTDGTWEIISEIASKDCRVKAFRNESNLGPVRNWLRCVEEATGTYGKILWSDDLIAPDYLESTLPFLDNPDIGFVFTATRVFDESPLEGQLHHTIGATGIYHSEQFIEGDLRGEGYPVSPGCALFRLQDLRSSLMLHVPNSVGSDFSMHAIGNDLLLFLLVAHKYPKFAFVSRVLSFFRAHAGSISISSKNSKLPLHYNMARAFFVEQYRPDLISKLNGRLYLHLLRFPDSKDFGVINISNFYMINKSYSFSRVWLLLLVGRKLCKKYLGV